jgi:hypothetical protein
LSGTFRSQGREHFRHALQGQGQLSTYTLSGTFRSQGREHLRRAPQGQGQLSNYTVSGIFGLPRIRDHFRHGLLEQGQLSNYALTGTTSCFPGRGDHFPVMPYRDMVSLVVIL